MEDQQPEPGVVTGAEETPTEDERAGQTPEEEASEEEVSEEEVSEEEAPVEETGPGETPADETPADESPADDDRAGEDRAGEDRAEDPDAEAEPADAPSPEALPAWRRPGRLVAAGLGVVAAVFVAAAGFAGAAMQPYLADRALTATKLDIARAAGTAITTLWTYTPDNIDALPDRAAGYLTGDMAAQYRKYIQAIAAQYSQAQISLESDVVGVAVNSVDGDEARVLVYTNTSWSSPQKKDIPGLLYSSYQVSLKRDHRRWLVTGLDPITSFSLRPQF